MADPANDDERRAWGARFGWLVGGLLGLIAGFVLTYGMEVWVLARRTRDATRAAGRISAVLVPGLFLAGALLGHTFGARGSPMRFKALGVAAGVLITVVGWVLVVVTR